ncbi:MAG: T9SS type A sorting domain-containing protein [Saprospiraceae bacterium]|nr:T9SS type A sorting domain-containing protein [Saprospiraceae bacterium]
MNINSRVRVYLLLVPILIGFSILAQAEIVVKTFHDENNNGSYDPGELLITGLSVSGVDLSGNEYGFTDDGAGTFRLMTVPSRMRVRVVGYSTDLRQGVAGPTSVFFAEDGDVINVPVLQELEFNSANSTILVPCFEKGTAADKINSPALVSFPYDVDGVAEVYGGTAQNPRMDATIAQLGSTWGMAFQSIHKRAFVSTILKRHVDLGPEGSGGIYIADYNADPEKPEISSFNLEGFHPSVGPVIHLGAVNRTHVDGEITDQPYALTSIEDLSKRASYDIDAFKKVGQLAYGDIDLSEDERSLWMVNTYQRSLIRLDVSKQDFAITAAALEHFKIDDLLNIPDTDMRMIRCINAGGNSNYHGSEAFTDRNGTAWDRNKYSIDGKPDYKRFNVANTMNDDEGTSESDVYHTWRKGRNFSYDIPIPKEENYTVILHFAEPNNYLPGDRIFDVLAEGVTMLDNFDIATEAGANHKAMTVSFTVPATGPTLRLDFQGEFGNKVREAIVNGIEIVGESLIKTGNLRPWGLDFHNGKGYLGLVNDAMYSQSREHLMGYVVSFDPNNVGAGVTEEVSFALDYPRERASNADAIEPQALRTAAWMPWVEEWEQMHIPLDDPLSFTGGLLCSYPQPLISEINFTEDGSMVINIMDRWAHQTGYMNYSTILGEKTLIIGYASGDILKAFKDGEKYDLEKSNNDDGIFYNNVDGPSYNGEFFYQDEYQSKDVAHHGELITGGAAILPGTHEVVSTVHNPIETTLEHFSFNGVFTQGVHFYSTDSGEKTRAYLFVDQFNIGKANGLGDIEFARGAPSGEVGNYLWCDANSNGIQDPAEFGIPGIDLTLHDKENSLQLIGSTTTDAMGQYVFQNLLQNHCYEIRVNLNQLMAMGYSGLTAPLNTGDPLIDSDGDPEMLPGYAVAMFCTDGQANNMHDIDFGFQGPRALDAVKSICEDPISGCATFTLSVLADCVDTTGVNEVRFFPSFNDADSLLNEILSPTYDVCDGEDTLYARVNIAGDMACFSIAQVRLVEINNASEPLTYSTIVCPTPTFDALSYLVSQGLTGGGSALLFSDPAMTMSISNPVATPTYPLTIYFQSMESTGGSTCTVMGSIRIDSIPAAMISAGNSVDGCGLNCIDLTALGASFNSNGSGATSATWSSSGSGTFQSDNSYANARFYCPDTNDMLNGSVTLSLTVNDDPCGRNIVSSVVINIFSSLPRFIDPGPGDTIDCVDPFVDDQVNFDTFPRCILVANCGDTITAHVTDYDIELGDCNGIVKYIIRHQRVVYAKEEYYCQDTIYVRGIDFDNITCPPMRDSVYCHTGYLTDHNGHPSPFVTGVPMAGNLPLWPQPNSKCELRILYFDEEFNGDCPMTIHRTWWIKDACNGREDTCEQWIMIFDTIGPTIMKDTTYQGLHLAPEDAFPDIDKPVLFVPTTSHDCEAYSYVPSIYAYDTCSEVKMVKAMLPGLATVPLTYNEATGKWESHEQIKIPRTDVPIPLIYEAYDFCHNITRDTCYFYVKDFTKPVAICDKGVNVTLSDTTVWLHAETFDEGSWDNCGISLLLARRTDWASACGVSLCDSIIPYCTTEHHDTLWCSVLEQDKHLNPIEAHYAETLRWLCEDQQECNSLVIGGWWYDLIKYATLECIDHPYPVDDKYLQQIFKDPTLECTDQFLDVGYLCTKLGFGYNANLPAFPAPLLTNSAETAFDVVKQIGGGWSKEVPFCCADACQDIVVELLAMDYWCNWNKCWTTVRVEDKTPPKVVSDLFDVNITCTSYKKLYEPAVIKAQGGDFTALDSLLGGYDKVRYDQYGGLPSKTPYQYHNITCDSILVKKDSLVYDEHLGYQWVSYHHYEAIYDTAEITRYRGQIADDCGLVCIEEKPWINLDHCGNGYIRRVFRFIGQCYSEAAVHKVDTITRYQTIWIQSDCDISKSMFKMPDDLVLYNCDLEYDPEGSGNAGGAADPEATGRPEYIFDDDCRFIGIGYYDKVFKIVGGDEGCYKIIRTWCMADWCSIGQYDGQSQWWFNPKYEGKYLTWTQKILLIDTIPPTCIIDLPDVIEASGCFYDLETTVLVEDNCNVLDYHWEILDAEDNLLGHGSGQIGQETEDHISIQKSDLEAGTYILKVYVTDECQNESICKKEFVIEPQKKPTPVCITALTLQLTPMDMDNNGVVDTAMGTVWASEFNRSSSAACGSLDSDLEYRLGRLADGEPTLPEADHLIFGCEDVGVVALRMYVLDHSGTWDYCEVMLTVQNDNGGCPTAALGKISGMITNELNRIVHNVDVTVTDPTGDMIAQDHISGDYRFEMVQGSEAYITPYKNTDHINGVSTRDLIDIQQHILGVEKLESWYQRQAADVNADGIISANDLIQIRKLILGMIDEFPENTSWRFFDKASHQERYHINPMRDIMRVDFMGVKIGDVNLDSDPSHKASRSNQSIKLVVSDLELEEGKVYEVPVRIRDFESIRGMQYTLQFDEHKIELNDLRTGNSSISDAQVFNLSSRELGWITSLWYDEKTESVSLSDDTEIFALKITALSDTKLSNVLSINSSHTIAEGYNQEMDLNMAMVFENEQAPSDNQAFALFQNNPNPFSHYTSIGFQLPESTSATLSVFDVTGRLLKVLKGTFAKGYNEVDLDRFDFPTSGILYYKLETDKNAAVKKMILMTR